MLLLQSLTLLLQSAHLTRPPCGDSRIATGKIWSCLASSRGCSEFGTAWVPRCLLRWLITWKSRSVRITLCVKPCPLLHNAPKGQGFAEVLSKYLWAVHSIRSYSSLISNYKMFCPFRNIYTAWYQTCLPILACAPATLSDHRDNQQWRQQGGEGGRVREEDKEPEEQETCYLSIFMCTWRFEINCCNSYSPSIWDNECIRERFISPLHVILQL